VIQVLTLDANAPLSEPKIAASAEMLAGPQYPPMNPMFSIANKRSLHQYSHMKPRHPNTNIHKLMQITTPEPTLS